MSKKAAKLKTLQEELFENSAECSRILRGYADANESFGFYTEGRALDRAADAIDALVKEVKRLQGEVSAHQNRMSTNETSDNQSGVASDS